MSDRRTADGSRRRRRATDAERTERDRRRRPAAETRALRPRRRLAPARRRAACRSRRRATSARRRAPPARRRCSARERLVLRRRRSCCAGRQRRRSTCSGPRMLGHATDIIVDGRRQPATGIDFAALHRILLRRAARSTSASSVLAWLQALHARRRRAAHDVRACASRRRGQAQPAAAAATSTSQPRGDLLSRVTNDIDNIAQSLQQTLSQCSPRAHRRRRARSMMFIDLAAAGARRAGHGPAVAVR